MQDLYTNPTQNTQKNKNFFLQIASNFTCIISKLDFRNKHLFLT